MAIPNIDNQLNYQAFLKKEYLNYLKAQGTSKKTQDGYISAAKSFLMWYIDTLQSTNTKLPEAPVQVIQMITTEVIYNYKQSLILDHQPIATINHTLSALRTFFRFCVTNKYIDDNPIEHIYNIKKLRSYFNISKETVEKIIDAYKSHLKTNPYTGVSIDKQMSDIIEFLDWFDKNNSATTP